MSQCLYSGLIGKATEVICFKKKKSWKEESRVQFASPVTRTGGYVSGAAVLRQGGSVCVGGGWEVTSWDVNPKPAVPTPTSHQWEPTDKGLRIERLLSLRHMQVIAEKLMRLT